MPAKSKKQYKYMQGVIHGNIKAKGLSKKKAREYVEGVDYSSLPKKVSKKGKRSTKKGKGSASAPETGYPHY